MVIKQIPAVRVAQVRYLGDEGLDFYHLREFGDAAHTRIDSALDEAHAEPSGPYFMHYEDRPDGSLTPILAVPIGDQVFDGTAGVDVEVLPAFEAVVTIHRGDADHDVVGPLYGQMHRFAVDHGYVPHGPGRDLVIGREGDDFVMELTLPVTSGNST